mmetsp:Transcript_33843/g.75378  ORF Transcript_33843/g.75378 Transcript_33843/m.75378 type:complete len:159 (-) Transcript_33843:1578-2054(-)
MPNSKPPALCPAAPPPPPPPAAAGAGVPKTNIEPPPDEEEPPLLPPKILQAPPPVLAGAPKRLATVSNIPPPPVLAAVAPVEPSLEVPKMEAKELPALPLAKSPKIFGMLLVDPAAPGAAAKILATAEPEPADPPDAASAWPKLKILPALEEAEAEDS